MTHNPDVLEFSLETPSERRARVLADEDSDLLWELIEIRKENGLTQADVAERLGLTQATIAAFERYDNDPKLSTIRRYAHAVGALVYHAVANDDGLASAYPTWGADAIVHMPIRQRSESVPRGGWRDVS